MAGINIDEIIHIKPFDVFGNQTMWDVDGKDG